MLTSASVVAGCGYHDVPEDGSVCPTELPSAGESCFGYDVHLSCGDSCSSEGVVSCGSDGEWQGTPVSCNPPPPPLLTECPEIPPTAGESCYQYEPGITCLGSQDCGTIEGTVCGESGTWESVVVFCNPPPPVDSGSPGGDAIDAGSPVANTDAE